MAGLHILRIFPYMAPLSSIDLATCNPLATIKLSLATDLLRIASLAVYMLEEHTPTQVVLHDALGYLP